MKKTHIASIAAASSLVLAGAFYAGVAYAADPKLDLAVDALTKAQALVESADNPGVKPPFGGHREAAIEHIKKAMKEIEKAKEYADKHQPKDKKDKK